MNKTLASILTIALLVPAAAFATQTPEPNECNESHTYTFSFDSSSNPANVDFINTGATGNPDSITVDADAGFTITSVELSIDDDGFSGFHEVATGPITNYNPNPGTTINVAKVTVRKDCPPPPPVDVCPNIAGSQAVVPEGMHIVDGQCVPIPPPVCPEGQVGTPPDCVTPPPPTCPEGQVGTPPDCVTPPPPVCPEGQVGTPPDCTTPEPEVCPQGTTGTPPECTPIEQLQCAENQHGTYPECIDNEVTPPPAETPAPQSHGGGGGGMPWCSGPMAPGWNVSLPNGGCGGPVVASTPAPETASTSCGPLLTTYLKKGKVNDKVQMILLKSFLNLNLGTNLNIGDPDFDLLTFQAVQQFQAKYPVEILSPWGIGAPTGYVYKTTQRWINMLHCSALNLPMPVLN